MTDAAIPVTQHAVEQFTEQYLRSIGCDIKIHGDEWQVTVPSSVETTLSTGEHTLVLGKNSSQKDGRDPLHPESEIFQQILSEASDHCPTGTIVIKTDDAEVEIPSWLQNSDVKLKEATFNPYYDRTAVVFLFQVSIETVSEYQREILRAIALDTRSGEDLPKLEKEFLQLTSLEEDSITSSGSELDESEIRLLLDPARNQLLERIQGLIDEIHEESSRAADAEVEEYRQMQQQRIEELEEKLSNLTSRIDRLNQSVEGSREEEHVSALKERKEVKSEQDEIQAKLNYLRERREQGFPKKQREIRDRHALDLRTTPLTMTQVEYERGEIELKLVEKDRTKTEILGYGSGVGITEEVRCTSCDRKLSDQNPLYTLREGFQCSMCNR
jgi:hypothetical protein